MHCNKLASYGNFHFNFSAQLCKFPLGICTILITVVCTDKDTVIWRNMLENTQKFDIN